MEQKLRDQAVFYLKKGIWYLSFKAKEDIELVATNSSPPNLP